MFWKRNKSPVVPIIEVRFLGRPGSSIVPTLCSRRKNAYVIKVLRVVTLKMTGVTLPAEGGFD
jgi:hypothetical protein